MINYLLVAKAKNLQNKNIIKKKKNDQMMQDMLLFFQLPSSRPWFSALLSTTSQTILKVL